MARFLVPDNVDEVGLQFWRSIPITLGDILLVLVTAIWGWDIGWKVGFGAIVFLYLLRVILPWGINLTEILSDLAAIAMIGPVGVLVGNLGFIYLVYHFWQREQIYFIGGDGVLGAIINVAVVYVATIVLSSILELILPARRIA